jgi:hypothetical protein
METQLKIEGKYKQYKEEFIKGNVFTSIDEYKAWLLEEVDNSGNNSFITENGEMESWKGDSTFKDKIINEIIRKEFGSINFPTPVIVFSATNKIWNIDTMILYGADNYYIKEHPDYSFDSQYSKENFKRLKLTVSELIKIGIKRREIWLKIKNVQDKLDKIDNLNIKSRIEEKLKIGYGLLFRKTTVIEDENLIFNNQIISFIAFWSILEEIVKDSFVDNWIKTGIEEGKMNGNKWILKNRTVFIDDLRTYNLGKNEGYLEVGIKYNTVTKYYEIGKLKIEDKS